MKRVQFAAGVAAAALAALATRRSASASASAYEVTHTDAQWRAMLGDDRFEILRRGGTEPAFSSPLIGEKRTGIVRVCGMPAHALHVEDQVRQRRRLAVVLGRRDQRHAYPGRLRIARRADGSALPAMRRSPRTHLRRRTRADALALLHRRPRTAIHSRRRLAACASSSRTTTASIRPASAHSSTRYKTRTPSSSSRRRAIAAASRMPSPPTRRLRSNAGTT